MVQDKYSIERLNQALDAITTGNIDQQKSALRIINAALCQLFASSHQEMVRWAVADKTRETLVSLLDSTPIKTIEVNCFLALCNVCIQIIDTEEEKVEDPSITAQEQKMKSITYQHATSFLHHRHIELRWQAALMCLHRGDARGWEIICRHLTSSRLDMVIPLIAETRNIVCNASSAEQQHNIHGTMVKPKDLISNQQAVELKRRFTPLAEKEGKRYPSEYTARRMNAAMRDLDDLIAKTAE